MSSCTAILLAMSMIVGQTEKEQETRGVPPKVLKQFEFLVGEWTAKGTTSDGLASEATISITWAPGKHMLLWKATWSDPEVKSLGSGLFGWDSAQEKIHTSEFWNGGGYHHRHYKIDSDKVWTGEEFSGVDKNGKPLRQKLKYEVLGPNKFKMSSWDRVVDGKKADGSAEITFTRK